MHEQTKEFLKRFKAELSGQGISLRGMDDELEEGIRHKFQESKDRPFAIDDYFRGTAAVKVDPYRLLARIAGYGDPLDLTALRGSRAPVWPVAQGRILKSLESLKKAGGAGFEEARLELRRIEHLHEDAPKEAERATWAWLEHERRPGAVVGLLSALAVHERKAKAHSLLSLACNILGEPLENPAGGKLVTAAGRCFIESGFVREGLHILEHFALRITDLYGDADEHAVVLFYISFAAEKIGAKDLSSRALEKAAQIGQDRLRFYSLQFLAYQELGCGNARKAKQLYDELATLPYFDNAPRQVRAAIKQSRLAARFASGDLDAGAIVEFEEAVAEIREVLPIREQVAAITDYAQFLHSIDRGEQGKHVLEQELWNALSLENIEVLRKSASLWDALKLPRDARWSTLTGRLNSIQKQCHLKDGFGGSAVRKSNCS